MYKAKMKITGRVQGVFFRATARDKALELGLSGYAKNTPDGAVESLVQGEKAAIEKYIAWCHLGPRSAKVENVEVTWPPEDKTPQFNEQGFKCL